MFIKFSIAVLFAATTAAFAALIFSSILNFLQPAVLVFIAVILLGSKDFLPLLSVFIAASSSLTNSSISLSPCNVFKTSICFSYFSNPAFVS